MLVLPPIVSRWIYCDWWVARKHGLGRGVVVWRGGIESRGAGLRVDNRDFCLAGEGGKRLDVLRNAQSYLSALQVDIDFEIEGVL